jgi:hypothetical protein
MFSSANPMPTQPEARFFGVPLMTGSMSEFTSVALCPEARHFATIGDSSKLTVADRITMRRFQLGSLTHARQVAFRPKNDGDAIEMAIVGALGESYIQRLNLRNEQLLESLPMGAATAVAYSRGGRFLAAGNINGLVRVWRFDDDKVVQVAERDFLVEVSSLAFNPNSSAVYATLSGQAVELPLRSSVSGVMERALDGAKTAYRMVAGAAQGDFVYFVAEDVVHVYDTASGEVGVIAPNVGRIAGIEVFPNSGHLCIYGERVVYVSHPVGPKSPKHLSLRSEFDARIYAVRELDSGVALVFHATPSIIPVG